MKRLVIGVAIVLFGVAVWLVLGRSSARPSLEAGSVTDVVPGAATGGAGSAAKLSRLVRNAGDPAEPRAYHAARRTQRFPEDFASLSTGSELAAPKPLRIEIKASTRRGSGIVSAAAIFAAQGRNTRPPEFCRAADSK